MANVNVNEYIDIDVDIEVDEFLNSCDSREINEVITWLKEEDYLSNKYEIAVSEKESLPVQMFMENLDKIAQNYYQLTNEEQELIEKIAKQF